MAALVAIGLTLFTGQFLLLFRAFEAGMPAGLASVTQQSQAFFTVLLAAVFLREVPSLRQCIGTALAFSGLAVIGLTIGGDLTAAALCLALAGAFSWAVGNVLVKRTADVPVFPLVVWASLVPPLPALLLSAIYDGHAPIIGALADASWVSLGAVVYLGTLATFVGYAIWGDLLQRYPAAIVTPLALLAPCAGLLSSRLAFGEAFLRYAGIVLSSQGLQSLYSQEPARVASSDGKGSGKGPSAIFSDRRPSPLTSCGSSALGREVCSGWIADLRGNVRQRRGCAVSGRLAKRIKSAMRC